jgi:hypothetical protein
MNEDPNTFPPPSVWPPPPTNTLSSVTETSPLAALDSFRVQNIWLILFLTIITFGIYAVFWLRRQNATLAQVQPGLKVTLLYGNIVLVCVILSAGLDIASLIGLPASLDTVSNGLDRIVGIMVLVLAFQVRNGFNLLLQAQKGDALWFSGVYTWLINVVYLQYKLNKNIQRRQAEMQFPTIG